VIEGLGLAPQIVCAAYWTLAVALLVVSTAATIVQPRLAARRATRKDQPPVSIILPVKLLEDGFEAAQDSALSQVYPQFEAVASSVDLESPASRRMREIFARFPNVPSRFLRSTAKFAMSPKVDNLYAPFTDAAHDAIFMKDANIVLEPDALAEHLRQLTGEVGLVCGIPYAARPENLAAHIEAAIMNGPHARMLFLASAFGQGFGVGKIMLFRRSDFLRAGGFGAISHTVGEDNAMAKAMRRIGLRTVFSHRPVRQELGQRNFLDIYNRQLRWSVIRRGDELFWFILEPIYQALPAIAAGAAAAPLANLSPVTGGGATFLLWFLCETLLSMAKGWQVSWAAPAIFLMREVVMLAVWLHAWSTDRVVWAKDRLDARAAGAEGDKNRRAAGPSPKQEG
jgi:ceramide glucosyltransferase